MGCPCPSFQSRSGDCARDVTFDRLCALDEEKSGRCFCECHFLHSPTDIIMPVRYNIVDSQWEDAVMETAEDALSLTVGEPEQQH